MSETCNRYLALATAFVLAGFLAACRPFMSSPRFNTPEATLQTYVEALRRGDKATVATCFDPPATDFYLPGPLRIDTFVIRKRIVYGPKETADWNDKGIVPPAMLGDIELEVEEALDGKKELYWYNLRKLGGSWKIVSHRSDLREPEDLGLRSNMPLQLPGAARRHEIRVAGVRGTRS